MTQKIESPALEAAAGLDEWIIEDLKKSGLTVEDFIIEPLRSEAELKERLGFADIGNTSIMSVGGCWIPYSNAEEYYRLKLRREIETKDGKVKYLSPKKELSKGNHAYILPHVATFLRGDNPDKPIFITEGEKKAAKATLEGFPCIGLAGVWNFKDGETDFLPEFDQYVWKDRTVYIVFDSDITEKHNVKQAELRLAVQLMNRGARVYSVRLPEVEQ